MQETGLPGAVPAGQTQTAAAGGGEGPMGEGGVSQKPLGVLLTVLCPGCFVYFLVPPGSEERDLGLL